MSVSRRRFFSLALGAGGLALGSTNLGRWCSDGPHKTWAERSGHALGTHVSMELYHADSARAERALDAAFAELASVENILSLYRADSQLSCLNRDGAIDNPHPYLLEVLTCAQSVAARSGGAFDVTVQPLWQLYYAAKKNGVLPSEREIAATRAKVDYRKLEVSNRSVRFTERGMAATFNGIAQGYAADRVSRILQDHGVVHALVNTGEIGSLGKKPSAEPWTVGIQDPRNSDAYAALANLDSLFLSTSGDYNTTFSQDRAYNHIFDPQTGISPCHFSSVTVVSPSGMLADAYSTTLFVLGAERGAQLLAQWSGISAYFIDKQDRACQTPGFPLVSGEKAGAA